MLVGTVGLLVKLSYEILMLAEPLKEVPAIVLAVARVVAVAAFPVQEPADPEVLPVTFPVSGPENAVAVQVPVTVTPPEEVFNFSDPL